MSLRRFSCSTQFAATKVEAFLVSEQRSRAETCTSSNAWAMKQRGIQESDSSARYRPFFVYAHSRAPRTRTRPRAQRRHSGRAQVVPGFLCVVERCRSRSAGSGRGEERVRGLTIVEVFHPQITQILLLICVICG